MAGGGALGQGEEPEHFQICTAAAERRDNVQEGTLPTGRLR